MNAGLCLLPSSILQEIYQFFIIFFFLEPQLFLVNYFLIVSSVLNLLISAFVSFFLLLWVYGLLFFMFLEVGISIPDLRTFLFSYKHLLYEFPFQHWFICVLHILCHSFICFCVFNFLWEFLDHGLFRTVLFNFQLFWDFSCLSVICL